MSSRLRTLKAPCPRCDGRGELERVDGASLREIRENAYLGLREFAERIGLSAAYVSDVELGRRRATEKIVEQYRRIA
jgi:DNA-binding transcriptional regulator YiaG